MQVAMLRQDRLPEHTGDACQAGSSSVPGQHQAACSTSSRQAEHASAHACQSAQRQQRHTGCTGGMAPQQHQQPQRQPEQRLAPEAQPSKHVHSGRHVGRQASATAGADIHYAQPTSAASPSDVVCPGAPSAHKRTLDPAHSQLMLTTADTAAEGAAQAATAAAQPELAFSHLVEDQDQAKVSNDADLPQLPQTGAQGSLLAHSDDDQAHPSCSGLYGHRIAADPSRLAASANQHVHPTPLLTCTADTEDESARGGALDLACAPRHWQGQVEDQDCTPGLVSAASPGCALPTGCSSAGGESAGESAGKGLEGENSIRFRKRSKFEVLKARREEARQKSEVMLKHPGLLHAHST